MKTLYESLLDDFDTLSQDLVLSTIYDFISKNYLFNNKSVQNVESMIKISKKPNKKTGLYEVKCTKKTITVKLSPDAPSLTNDIFTWTTVAGNFVVKDNPVITTLKGCPKEVGGGFVCDSLPNITSLEGCPKEVGGLFDCEALPNVTSLENGPKTVGRFMCWCMDSVKTLQFCPIIKNGVTIGYNKNLETLKGLEYETGKVDKFYCVANPKLKEVISCLPKYVAKRFLTGCNGDWLNDDDANLNTMQLSRLMNKGVIDFDRDCEITYESPTGPGGERRGQDISYYVFK